MSSNYAIEVRGLTKRFGPKTVVDHISLRIPKGKILGFLGPNGSGKTTTIRMLCGLLTPDEGEGQCLGFNLRTESAKIRRRIGYMTQKFSFWEDLTIRENLMFVAELFELPRPAERVKQALKELGLSERANQLAGALSGGWKQRLALSACILHEPELLLLDEPTAGVDPLARREFWDEIHRLAANGITVLVSTHYMDEAERCHEIVYITSGRIAAEGTVQEVIAGAGLTTFLVDAGKERNLAEELKRLPGIASVAPFGNTLHVSGTDAEALRAALRPWEEQGVEIREGEPSLEDVFIHYMSATGGKTS